jgi:LPXTG-motif cell wall-anchored protein
MRRATLLASAMVFAPLIALAPSLPAYAGLQAAGLGLTHSPSTFTVGQVGTLTVTLDNPDTPDGSLNEYDVIDTVPASFDITNVDPGDYDCTSNNTAHTVECTITAEITETNSASFTIEAEPSTAVGSPFTNTASYTFQGPSAPSGNAKHAGQPALAIQGETALDMVPVNAAATPTPTARPSTPAPTPTPTPTHTPTHHPTHTPTPTPSPSVSATHVVAPPATLPNTGGSDLAQLVAIGALMISAGGFLAAITRRRRA